ncbi:D-galactarate dehydratase [Paracoccaceae bacterium Fryx2]|nr:D-galactarate dehydratase [Paracoccaceae bacterium Fryx2]
MKHSSPPSVLAAVLAALALSGCDLPIFQGNAPTAPAPTAAAPMPRPAPMVGAGGASAAALDTTSPAERAAAAALPAPAGERELGRVVVGLGSVTEPGFWLQSPLVTAKGPGRVVTAAGASVQVELRPGTGGAQLSLAAFRSLGLGLTDLPEVRVLAR